MKRINKGSSSTLNEAIFESLKPLYGSKGDPPYYDPNDLHVHTWKKGKLGLEDNPKIKTYAKGKLSIRDCVYCKSCHKIKDSFQSTVGSNIDIVDDIIMPSFINVISDYTPVKFYEIEHQLKIEKAPEKIINSIPTNTSQKLFHNREGIFNNYVSID